MNETRYRVISLRCRILLSFFSEMARRKYTEAHGNPNTFLSAFFWVLFLRFLLTIREKKLEKKRELMPLVPFKWDDLFSCCKPSKIRNKRIKNDWGKIFFSLFLKVFYNDILLILLQFFIISIKIWHLSDPTMIIHFWAARRFHRRVALMQMSILQNYPS